MVNNIPSPPSVIERDGRVVKIHGRKFTIWERRLTKFPANDPFRGVSWIKGEGGSTAVLLEAPL